jgi:hypothetical protein
MRRGVRYEVIGIIENEDIGDVEGERVAWYG